MVAKQHVTMAEIWEVEPEQLVESIEHYRKASAIFRGEEQQSQANKCDLKAAQMLATNKSYQEAVQLFEQVSQIGLILMLSGFDILNDATLIIQNKCLSLGSSKCM